MQSHAGIRCKQTENAESTISNITGSAESGKPAEVSSLTKSLNLVNLYTEESLKSTMYYEDLATFNDLDWETGLTFQVSLVGWLDTDHTFTKGSVTEDFLDRLFIFCYYEYAVNRTKGFHPCFFCEPFIYECKKVTRNSVDLWLGTAEIRVISSSKIYCAPDLIFHYVSDHGYCPPQEFIDAIMHGPLPNTPEYKNLLAVHMGIPRP